LENNTQNLKLNGTYLYLGIVSKIRCFAPADSLHHVISSILCDFSTEAWSANLFESHNGILENMTTTALQEDRCTSIMSCDVLLMKCSALNSGHLFLHSHQRTYWDHFPPWLKSRATLPLADLLWLT